MQAYLLISLLVPVAYCTNGLVSICNTPDGGIGLCKRFDQCEYFKRELAKLHTASTEMKNTIIKSLQKRICSHAEFKICCSDCLTPDNKSGIRTHWDNCPHLQSLLYSTSPGNIDFVRKSRLHTNTYDVCCGSAPVGSATERSVPAHSDPAGTTLANAGAAKQQPDSSRCSSIISSPPDPSTECCGIDTSIKSKIAGGENTSIYEYPWTVLLEYESAEQIQLHCAGSLISNRYVVTARHCIAGDHAWPPINVRVGEWDTKNPGQDCVQFPDKSQLCTEGAITIPIEALTIHPKADIALVKLATPVNYTAFVRPICLPSSNPPPNANYTVTGWGKLSRTRGASRFKQYVNVSEFKFKGLFAQLCKEFICTGGKKGKDSCKGDSGGPLMLLVNSDVPHYELAGVVSFGPKDCGNPNLPNFYTHVYRHINWIRENMNQ